MGNGPAETSDKNQAAPAAEDRNRILSWEEIDEDENASRLMQHAQAVGGAMQQPVRARAMSLIGDAQKFREQENFKDALTTLGKCADLPLSRRGAEHVKWDLSVVYLEYGRQLYRNKKYEEALIQFETGWALIPNTKFQYNIALCAQKLGDKKRAIQACQLYLARPEGNADIRDVIGTIVQLSEELHTGAEATPEAAKTEQKLAGDLYVAKKWDAAIEHFLKAFQLAPHPDFLFNIAKAYEQSDRPTFAYDYCEQYLQKVPGDAKGTQLMQELKRRFKHKTE